MPDIHRLSYYLILAMLMSLLWGIFVMMVGMVLRYGIGQLIENYVKDLDDVVDLRWIVNDQGVNICPVETSPKNNIDLGDWSTAIGSLVIVSGAMIIAYSLSGLGAALLHSAILLFLLLLVIGSVCCLEYYILHLTTDIYNSFHVDAQNQLVFLLHSDYQVKSKVNMFTGTMNAIMLRTQCCGIRGPADFKNLTFYDDGQKVHFVVSPACCKKSIFSSKPEETFSLLIDCARTGHAHMINYPGCYSEVYKYVADNYGNLIVVGLVVLVVWQVFQMLFIVMLLFKSPTVHKPQAIKDVQRVMLDQVTSKKPVKFLPYWKTSSYVHQDVTRIRSTEIW